MDERVIFMGTPEFAAPTLRALAMLLPANRLLVISQPDRPAGRGRRMQSPPVKVTAAELSLDVIQVETLRDEAVRQRLTDFAPTLIVVAAFGLLLPRWVLELPTEGCVNLHASLLPRFRGASPIAAAIACGNVETGVSLMRMERGLDTGPIYAVQTQEIQHNDSSESLTVRLAADAARLLEEHVLELLEGAIPAMPQRGTIIETRKLVKAHGAVDWNQTAATIERQVRAMWPWPRAWTETEDGTRLQIHASEVQDALVDAPPGTNRHLDGNVAVATRDQWLTLSRVQLPGKSSQPSSDLLRHPSFAQGTRFGFPKGFRTPDPWIQPVGVTL